MTEALKAFFKTMLSYTKRKWDIGDYPLRYKNRGDLNGLHDVGGLKPWVVQVINWWAMIGLGDTKQEAYEQLKRNFTGFIEHSRAPRPGTKVPAVFANTSGIRELEDVAPYFFQKILDINYFECFVSDESSLGDFGQDDEETLIKINKTYDLDLTDLGDGNLVRLLTIVKDKVI